MPEQDNAAIVAMVDRQQEFLRETLQPEDPAGDVLGLFAVAISMAALAVATVALIGW